MGSCYCSSLVAPPLLSVALHWNGLFGLHLALSTAPSSSSTTFPPRVAAASLDNFSSLQSSSFSALRNAKFEPPGAIGKGHSHHSDVNKTPRSDQDGEGGEELDFLKLLQYQTIDKIYVILLIAYFTSVGLGVYALTEPRCPVELTTAVLIVGFTVYNQFPYHYRTTIVNQTILLSFLIVAASVEM